MLLFHNDLHLLGNLLLREPRDVTTVEASKRHHQQQQQQQQHQADDRDGVEGRLSASQRTISLPSGINKGGARGQTNFYVRTPPSTPLGKQAPPESGTPQRQR